MDNPSELQLIAQFDQAPDAATGKGLFNDFRGLVNPTPQCAPELNIFIACDPALQPPPPPGTPFTGSQAIDLVGTVTQVTPGNRVALASGEAQLLPGTLDTAFANVAAGRVAQGVTTELANTGVPFIFVDRGVRNSLRYFYAVTAFDVNSLVSGPSSLETARVTKPVIPAPTPSNQVIQTSLARHVVGRDVGTDTLFSVPTIDPATGRFSGPTPPSDGGVVEFVGEFAGAVIQPDQGGELSMRLDSITAGQWNTTGCCAVGSAGFPSTYYLTLKSPTDSFKVTTPLDLTYTFPGPALAADTTFFHGPGGGPGRGPEVRGLRVVQLCRRSGRCSWRAPASTGAGAWAASRVTSPRWWAPRWDSPSAPTTARAGSTAPRRSRTRPWPIPTAATASPTRAAARPRWRPPAPVTSRPSTTPGS